MDCETCIGGEEKPDPLHSYVDVTFVSGEKVESLQQNYIIEQVGKPTLVEYLLFLLITASPMEDR